MTYLFTLSSTWPFGAHKDESGPGQQGRAGITLPSPHITLYWVVSRRPVDLGPSELTLEREAGFGPAEIGKTDPPRSGGQGQTSKLMCLTVSEDSGFLRLRI